jgi:ABC-type nitrate/sulfonate/bicarbonate transport system substrate-binding protein
LRFELIDNCSATIACTSAENEAAMFRALLATLSFLVILVLPRLGYTQSIRINYAGTSGYNVPIWVTHEAGLFKKHGLNSELIMIAGAAQSMQAMLANETQVANTSGSAPINAKLKGADTVIIASSYDLIRFIDTLYTR